MLSTRLFEDGLERCSWPHDELYTTYHDTEWGVELTGDDAMFERVALEGFQAGLNWITILRRREGFRAGFANFQMTAVAEFNEADVARLMADPGIIRNRAKIEATIKNARLALELPGGLSDFVWNFAPDLAERNQGREFRAVSNQSEALSKALRKQGFGFVGPTTMYALMQATGMVNDHAVACFRHSELA